MNCKRCGLHTPRTSLNQRYCPPCDHDVNAIIANDTRRRMPRFTVAKSLDRSPA